VALEASAGQRQGCSGPGCGDHEAGRRNQLLPSLDWRGLAATGTPFFRLLIERALSPFIAVVNAAPANAASPLAILRQPEGQLTCWPCAAALVLQPGWGRAELDLVTGRNRPTAEGLLVGWSITAATLALQRRQQTPTALRLNLVIRSVASGRAGIGVSELLTALAVRCDAGGSLERVRCCLFAQDNNALGRSGSCSGVMRRRAPMPKPT